MTSTTIRYLMVATLLSILPALPMVVHGAPIRNPDSISSGAGAIGGGDWAAGVGPERSLDVSGPAYPHGHAFEFGGSAGDAPWHVAMLFDRAPMEWGFHPRGGSDSFTRNRGIGDHDGDRILAPDSVSYRVPEPGTMLLLGGGLLSLAVWRRRRMRMRD